MFLNDSVSDCSSTFSSQNSLMVPWFEIATQAVDLKILLEIRFIEEMRITWDIKEVLRALFH